MGNESRSIAVAIVALVAGLLVGCGSEAEAAEVAGGGMVSEPEAGAEAGAEPGAEPGAEADSEAEAESGAEAGAEAESDSEGARGSIGLARLVVAGGVEGREPVEAGASFPRDGGPLYAFLEARNPTSEPLELEVAFEGPDGRSLGRIDLRIPASVPRWRTWARTRRIGDPGDWRVIVRTTEGEVVGQTPFRIEG